MGLFDSPQKKWINNNSEKPWNLLFTDLTQYDVMLTKLMVYKSLCFADDVISIHMKDGFVTQKVSGSKMVNGILERPVDLTPLGQGELPIKELVAAIPEQVNTIVVELDFCCKEMHTALRESYEYMTQNNLAQGNK